MWSNPQFSVDLVTFTEEIFNGKRNFLCSAFIASGITFPFTLFRLFEFFFTTIANFGTKITI